MSNANITTLAREQIDSCFTNCSDGLFISSSKLTFNASRSDNGKTLYCTAISSVGLLSVQSELKQINVKYGPITVSLDPPNTEYIISENGTIGLVSCWSSCNPVCQYVWTGPGGNNQSNELHIINIKRDQSGNYTCTALNGIGSSQRQIIVVVQYSPTSMSLNISASELIIVEHQQLGPVSCKADCVPECSYRWEGPTITVVSPVLQLNNISRFQSGSYLCTAVNSHGKLSIGLKVQVLTPYPPQIDKKKTSSPEMSGLGIGMNLTITIYLKALPTPSFSWCFRRHVYSNNIDLHVTTFHQSNGTEHVSKLFISRLESEHYGYYIVIANNTAGTYYSTFHVVKQSEPSVPNPVFVVCKSTAAVVQWKSGFDGGLKQIFNIQFWIINQTTPMPTPTITDAGLDKSMQYTVNGLTSDTEYGFILATQNEIGYSYSSQLKCKTSLEKESPMTNSDKMFNAGIALVTFGVIAIMCLVAVLLFLKLWQRQKKKSGSKDYTEFQSYDRNKGDSYDSLNKTKKTEYTHDDNLHTYEECQTQNVTEQVHDSGIMEMEK